MDFRLNPYAPGAGTLGANSATTSTFAEQSKLVTSRAQGWQEPLAKANEVTTLDQRLWIGPRRKGIR